MDEFLRQIGENLAAQVTKQVIDNLRLELGDLNKDAQLFCYSEEEAAEKLGVEAKTLYRKRKNGEIDYSRSPSGKPVYLPRHLSEYLARHEVRNGHPVPPTADNSNFPQLKLAS